MSSDAILALQEELINQELSEREYFEADSDVYTQPEDDFDIKLDAFREGELMRV